MCILIFGGSVERRERALFCRSALSSTDVRYPKHTLFIPASTSSITSRTTVRSKEQWWWRRDPGGDRLTFSPAHAFRHTHHLICSSTRRTTRRYQNVLVWFVYSPSAGSALFHPCQCRAQRSLQILSIRIILRVLVIRIQYTIFQYSAKYKTLNLYENKQV